MQTTRCLSPSFDCRIEMNGILDPDTVLCSDCVYHGYPPLYSASRQIIAVVIIILSVVFVSAGLAITACLHREPPLSRRPVWPVIAVTVNAVVMLTQLSREWFGESHFPCFLRLMTSSIAYALLPAIIIIKDVGVYVCYLQQARAAQHAAQCSLLTLPAAKSLEFGSAGGYTCCWPQYLDTLLLNYKLYSRKVQIASALACCLPWLVAFAVRVAVDPHNRAFSMGCREDPVVVMIASSVLFILCACTLPLLNRLQRLGDPMVLRNEIIITVLPTPVVCAWFAIGRLELVWDSPLPSTYSGWLYAMLFFSATVWLPALRTLQARTHALPIRVQGDLGESFHASAIRMEGAASILSLDTCLSEQQSIAGLRWARQGLRFASDQEACNSDVSILLRGVAQTTTILYYAIVVSAASKWLSRPLRMHDVLSTLRASPLMYGSDFETETYARRLCAATVLLLVTYDGRAMLAHALGKELNLRSLTFVLDSLDLRARLVACCNRQLPPQPESGPETSDLVPPSHLQRGRNSIKNVSVSTGGVIAESAMHLTGIDNVFPANEVDQRLAMLNGGASLFASLPFPQELGSILPLTPPYPIDGDSEHLTISQDGTEPAKHETRIDQSDIISAAIQSSQFFSKTYLESIKDDLSIDGVDGLQCKTTMSLIKRFAESCGRSEVIPELLDCLVSAESRILLHWARGPVARLMHGQQFANWAVRLLGEHERSLHMCAGTLTSN